MLRGEGEGTYICRDDLHIPGAAGEDAAKERMPDDALATVTANHVICLHSAPPSHRLHIGPRPAAILADIQHTVVEPHTRHVVLCEMAFQDHAHLVHRQAGQSVRVLPRQGIQVHGREDRPPVRSPVRERPWEVAEVAHVVEDAGSSHLPDARRAVQGGAECFVRSVGGLEDFNGDAVAGEVEGQDQTARSGADDDDLGV